MQSGRSLTLLAATPSWTNSTGFSTQAIDHRRPSRRSPVRTNRRRLTQELGAAPEKLHELAPRVVLLLDAYDHLRVLDTWIRQSFVPSLHDTVRVVVASRHPPNPPWLIEPERQGHFAAIALGPLNQAESVELLRRRGYPEADSAALIRIAKGHPLSLSLGSVRPVTEASEGTGVLQRLAQLYLADAVSTDVRSAIEASSVLRRVTQPLLAALLPDLDAVAIWEELSRLALYELTREGLMLHDAVRDAVSASLRARDPGLQATFRRNAWRRLRAEAAKAETQQRGRITFDLIFLLEHPAVREAFFPSTRTGLSIEPASAAHRLGIAAILERHDSTRSAEALLSWWKHRPAAFRVARNEQGIAGFYVSLDASQALPELVKADPMTQAWVEHLRTEPLPRGQNAILIRRWLSAETGEAPSPVQAECWLDVKRTYLEMRSSLRRCYIVVGDLSAYAAVAAFLGFVPIATVTYPGSTETQHLAMLDFGPASLDGWIGRLPGCKLDTAAGELLDQSNHQLCVDGGRVDLTSLEFGVLRFLRLHEGQPVSRDQLLHEVWGQSFDGGSNVVDVIVSGLRQKLGSQAGRLTTVRGVGYRLHGTVQ